MRGRRMTIRLGPGWIIFVSEPGCKPGNVAVAFADEPTSGIQNEKYHDFVLYCKNSQS